MWTTITAAVSVTHLVDVVTLVDVYIRCRIHIEVLWRPQSQVLLTSPHNITRPELVKVSMDTHAGAVDHDSAGVVSIVDTTVVARRDDDDPGFGIVPYRAVM
jgi:hypothetical protein